ncbi:hypothetical protein MP228_009650 [Amoeboaphelidium protococcarum]|nr:hypothetical protein MP228_009650 [Amoeboaphelidium protococcarum]
MKAVQCVNLLSDDGSSVVVGPASQKKNFKNRLSTKNISNSIGKENVQQSSSGTATQRVQLSYNSLSTSTDNNSTSSTSLNSIPLDTTTTQEGQKGNNVINRVECPLCQKLFDDKSIVQHAAECQGGEESTRAHPKSSSRDSFYHQLDNLSTEDLNNILDFESQNSSVIVLDSQVDGVSAANQNKSLTSRSNCDLNGRLFSESEQLSPLKGFTPLDQLPPHEAEAYRNHINLHNNDGGGDVDPDGNDIIKINYTYANAKKPYAQKKKSSAYGKSNFRRYKRK